MLWNLLDSTVSSSPENDPWGTWIMFGVIFVVMIAFMVFNNRSQKKRQEEQNNTLNAIKAGNKVKTIGGICGVVVEVCEDDNTFIVETGSEKSGKSYIKFDRQAIYQTDAVAQKPVEPKKEEPAQEKTEE